MSVKEYIAVGGVVVKAAGSITSLEGLIEELGEARDAKYAKQYYAWVKGGRKGNPPAGQPNKKGSKRHNRWKFIRSVVNSLI